MANIKPGVPQGIEMHLQSHDGAEGSSQIKQGLNLSKAEISFRPKLPVTTNDTLMLLNTTEFFTLRKCALRA